MIARTAAEALYIAAEMERRAIRLYERALLIFEDGAVDALIKDILEQEKEHLFRFTHMEEAAQPEFLEAELLSSQAAQVFFAGGLMEAQRVGAFESAAALLQYAMEQEKIAIAHYTGFSENLSGGVKDAFLRIAAEEAEHLQTLGQMQKNVSR